MKRSTFKSVGQEMLKSEREKAMIGRIFYGYPVIGF